MQESLLRALNARRPEIRGRWEALLRIERVNTPLANPDTLIYLFDWTLDEIFAVFRNPVHGPPLPSAAFRCECGRNPFVPYFVAGKQALIEALIWVQAEIRDLDAVQRDASFSEVCSVIDHLQQREVSSFCGLCQHHSSLHLAAVPLKAGSSAL
jgi:hypothetical protein